MHLNATRNEFFARKCFAHVKNGTTDQAEAPFEYDLAIYCDPTTALRECERLFDRIPVMAAHSSELPTPGSFLRVQLSSNEILLTRRADGSLSALLNVCRHRGTTLVQQERGQRAVFTCPYHAWTYDNAGRIKSMGFQESVGIACDERRNLVSFPVEEKHGFIWVLENPAGTLDLAAHLGPLDDALQDFRLGDYHFHKSQVFEFPQNWKIALDGLIDGYHVRFLHKQTISPFFYHNIMAVEYLGQHALWAAARKSIDEILHEEPGASPIYKRVILGSFYWPNSVIVFHPHHAEYWSIYPHPHDTARCRMHLRYLTPRVMDSEKDREIIEKNWRILTEAVINEDVPAGNTIQASSAMRHRGKVILGTNEVINQLFHRQYRSAMTGQSE